jgi:hypothetical protein
MECEEVFRKEFFLDHIRADKLDKEIGPQSDPFSSKAEFQRHFHVPEEIEGTD